MDVSQDQDIEDAEQMFLKKGSESDGQMNDFYKILNKEDESYKIKNVVAELVKSLLIDEDIKKQLSNEFEELPSFMNHTKEFMITEM